jgi:hypothetical protein
MKTLVHRIRLQPGVTPDSFERWVKERDYLTCPKLLGVSRFNVHRVSRAPEAAFHYFEVIEASSLEAFEADMQRPEFQALVKDFNQLATVVDELSGERIEPGYQR